MSKEQTTITEVFSAGCECCSRVSRMLEEEIKPLFPGAELRHIDMTSPEGQELIAEHGIGASPGILVNGELVSVGDVDKDTLVQKIKEK